MSAETFVQSVNVMGGLDGARLTVNYGNAYAAIHLGPLSLFGNGETALDQIGSIEEFARAVLAQCEAERQALRDAGAAA